MAFSYNSMDVSQRNSFKWLLWPKDRLMLNYINNYHLTITWKKKKNTKTCIWHLFYPFNSRELILWYWFSNPFSSMLIDQICNFLLQIRTRHFQQWAVPEKIQTWAKGWGHEISTPGVLKKGHVKIPGPN